MKQTRRGFTLVELIVVISIISAVAATLMPVFATAREKARQTVCASNLHQLAQAALMYRSDWDDKFSTRWVGKKEGVEIWNGICYTSVPVPEGGVLWPYIRNKNIYKCPEVKFPVSYGFNPYITVNIETPTETFLFREMNRGAVMCWQVMEAELAASPHSGGANVAFADGHVKWSVPTLHELHTPFYNGGNLPD